MDVSADYLLCFERRLCPARWRVLSFRVAPSFE